MIPRRIDPPPYFYLVLSLGFFRFETSFLFCLISPGGSHPFHMNPSYSFIILRGAVSNSSSLFPSFARSQRCWAFFGPPPFPRLIFCSLPFLRISSPARTEILRLFLLFFFSQLRFFLPLYLLPGLTIWPGIEADLCLIEVVVYALNERSGLPCLFFQDKGHQAWWLDVFSPYFPSIGPSPPPSPVYRFPAPSAQTISLSNPPPH